MQFRCNDFLTGYGYVDCDFFSPMSLGLQYLELWHFYPVVATIFSKQAVVSQFAYTLTKGNWLLVFLRWREKSRWKNVTKGKHLQKKVRGKMGSKISPGKMQWTRLRVVVCYVCLALIVLEMEFSFQIKFLFQNIQVLLVLCVWLGFW